MSLSESGRHSRESSDMKVTATLQKTLSHVKRRCSSPRLTLDAGTKCKYTP